MKLLLTIKIFFDVKISIFILYFYLPSMGNYIKGYGLLVLYEWQSHQKIQFINYNLVLCSESPKGANDASTFQRKVCRH